MKQITIQVEDDQQVNQILAVLSDFDFVNAIEVEPLWSPAGQNGDALIKIIESDSGPMISESRVSVYDVMEAYDEGHSIYEIHQLYHLSSHQIQVALDYIEQHRATLEPELKEIQAKLAAREQYDRALAAERERQIPSIMTPERVTLKALLAESRRKRGELAQEAV